MRVIIYMHVGTTVGTPDLKSLSAKRNLTMRLMIAVRQQLEN